MTPHTFLFHLGTNQCDQMVTYITIQSLPIYNKDNLFSSRYTKVGTKVCQILNKPSKKLPKDY